MVRVRDAGGFDDLYRSTSPRLLRYCSALTEAQDVAQEAYVRAWRHWRQVSGHPAPGRCATSSTSERALSLRDLLDQR